MLRTVLALGFGFGVVLKEDDILVVKVDVRKLIRGGMVVVLKLYRAEGTFMLGVKLENRGRLGAMARVDGGKGGCCRGEMKLHFGFSGG